jgi:hypothetical protein
MESDSYSDDIHLHGIRLRLCANKLLLITHRNHVIALFAWLISHQPAVLFSQNKPVSSNQPTVLFSQNKPAPAISHQPSEQAVYYELVNQTLSNFITTPYVG